jgi:hypothetical protein
MYIVVISAECAKQICAHHLGGHDCGLSASVVCLNLLNSWYTFHDMLENCQLRAADVAQSGRYIVVKVMNPAEIVNQFTHFTRANLQAMALAHNLGNYGTRPKAIVQQDLLFHQCNGSCSALFLVFKGLLKERVRRVKVAVNNVSQKTSGPMGGGLMARIEENQAAQSVRQVENIVRILESEQKTVNEFPVIADSDLRSRIILDWQARERSLKTPPMFCAVCRYAIHPSEGCTVEPNLINFSLLQNAYLPDNALPVNYNREAYSNAILYYKGLHRMDSL